MNAATKIQLMKENGTWKKRRNALECSHFETIDDIPENENVTEEEDNYKKLESSKNRRGRPKKR